MAQWTNKDEQAGAPTYVVDATTGRTGTQEYGNTVFGYTPTEASASSENLSSPGWVRVVKGEGKLTGLNIDNGGTGYANTDTVTVGTATGTITTDDEGVIEAIEIDFDDDLVSEVPEVEITTTAGTGAVITVRTSGRLGRVTSETLVAMRHIQA